MNIFNSFQIDIKAIIEDLSSQGALPAGLDTGRVSAEPPRDASHGDVSTNAAMVLAKPAAMKPRDLAELLAGRLGGLQGVSKATVAGPGFINLTLDDGIWRKCLVDVLKAGLAYGESDLGKTDQGERRKVNVEYVSANPTGPLHVGHGRGAVFGDVLASLLSKAGFDVTREYYVNDAGAQVDMLARSAHMRYREALGEKIGDMGEDLYPGEYLKDVGAALAARDGAKWSEGGEAEWLDDVRGFAIAAMMDLIRADLDAVGIDFDVFTSERGLVDSNRVTEVLDGLAKRELIYTGTLAPPKGKVPDDWEPRPQTLFKATEFGDDLDRPLKKSDGSWTYFAADIAYHLDKYQRGFNEMIDVWGADHGGYVKRMKAAVTAVSEGKAALDVKICQLVNLLDKGLPVKMSKRAGTFVTLRDVVDEVGKDVVRFIMLTRKNDAPLDFDLTKVTEQSHDNPVFYVQYAHARCCSVLRRAAEEFPGLDLAPKSLAKEKLENLTGDEEIALIKLLATWPRQIENAAEAHEPHRIAFYLHDLAAAFHGLWNKGNTDPQARFIVDGERDLTAARLALLRGTALVIASGLEVLGVTPVEEMR